MTRKKKKSRRVSQDAGSKNYQPTQAKREAKKEAVLGTSTNRRMQIIVLATCALLIAGGIFFYNSQTGVKTGPVTAQYSTAETNSQVILPAALFTDGKARHFEHVDGKFTIRYFVLKSSDGIIRAAFDACDVCWPAGKGYYQEGDYMVCRNCGRRFASVLVNEVKGGCNPAPLNRTFKDGKVIIQVKDILEGKQYFNFS
jgi:uncharacterized membrane protein